TDQTREGHGRDSLDDRTPLEIEAIICRRQGKESRSEDRHLALHYGKRATRFLWGQRHVRGPRRLARHQLDGGCRQLRAPTAGAAKLGHDLLGKEGHLLLDLRAAEARHFEVAQEQEVL